MSKSAITGAFGYSGKYIARKLLAAGEQVITLTGNPNRPNPFDGQIKAFPFNFHDPNALAASLRGVDTLYNTYWVRFDHGATQHSGAVENTLALFHAAQSAGVRRVVHVSITNPSLDSHLPYFRGKAQLEQALQASGLSYAILRPTVIFGQEDILINNIAWLLRRFPLFALPGNGSYRLQPIFVEDLAALAVQAGRMEENLLWDAVGPRIYRFDELVSLLRATVGSRAGILRLPPGLALNLSRLVGIFVGDVILTRDEVDGLMADLLVSAQPPRGQTRLEDWLKTNRETFGTRYANELKRHFQS